MSKEPDPCTLSSEGLVLVLERNTLHMEGEKHPGVPSAGLNALWDWMRLEIFAVKSFLQTS